MSSAAAHIMMGLIAQPPKGGAPEQSASAPDGLGGFQALLGDPAAPGASPRPLDRPVPTLDPASTEPSLDLTAAPDAVRAGRLNPDTAHGDPGAGLMATLSANAQTVAASVQAAGQAAAGQAKAGQAAPALVSEGAASSQGAEPGAPAPAVPAMAATSGRSDMAPADAPGETKSGAAQVDQPAGVVIEASVPAASRPSPSDKAQGRPATQAPTEGAAQSAAPAQRAAPAQGSAPDPGRALEAGHRVASGATQGPEPDQALQLPPASAHGRPDDAPQGAAAAPAPRMAGAAMADGSDTTARAHAAVKTLSEPSTPNAEPAPDTELTSGARPATEKVPAAQAGEATAKAQPTAEKVSAKTAEAAPAAAAVKPAASALEGSISAPDTPLRGERTLSDMAAMRAPGELARAAARQAGEPAVSKPDLAAKAMQTVSPAAGPESAAAKPVPSAQGAPVPPAIAMAAMAGASPAAMADPALGGFTGAEIEGEADLDAMLDPALSRGEARADAQRSALPTAANAHAAARFQPQTVQTLAARIAARAVEGGRVFDIRLDPAELGRVEVRLEMGADNSVRALLSAERADTLAELQRSARDLEKSLAEAGLDLAEDGLSFSLSDERGGDDAQEGGPAFNGAAWARVDAGAETVPTSAPLRLYGFDLATKTSLDVRI